MDDWIFGCDICQDVCPWNRFSTATTENEFQPDIAQLNKSNKEWLEITEEVFQNIYKDSPLSRTGFNGIKRNVNFIELPDEMTEQ